MPAGSNRRARNSRPMAMAEAGGNCEGGGGNSRKRSMLAELGPVDAAAATEQQKQ